MKNITFILPLWIVIMGVIACGSHVWDGNKCPDCGEVNCIYQQINDRVKEGTDQDIENAIQSVCKERKITDPKTIDLLRANYYL